MSKVKYKPSRVLISYADERFREEQKLFEVVHKDVADRMISYNQNDIPDAFKPLIELVKKLPCPSEATDWYGYKAYKCNFWLWKPILILHTLSNLKEGDLLIYADSKSRINDMSIFDDIEAIFENNKEFPFIVSMNAFYLERVCLPVMFSLLDMNETKYKEALQFSAHTILMKNTSIVRRFVLNWLQNMLIGEPPGSILVKGSEDKSKIKIGGKQGEFCHSLL